MVGALAPRHLCIPKFGQMAVNNCRQPAAGHSRRNLLSGRLEAGVRFKIVVACQIAACPVSQRSGILDNTRLPINQFAAAVESEGLVI